MLLSLLILGCGVEDSAAWRTPLAHRDRSHAVRVVPPIALPRPSAKSDVEIWLSIPDGASLGGSNGDWVYPAGTVVDRVEFRETSTGRRVVDVRGTSIDAQGKRWHHVYRPTRKDPVAPLHGAQWPADDPEVAEATIDRLMLSLQSHGVRRTDGIRAKLDCNSCHVLNRPDNRRRGEFGLVARGTDSTGFFTMKTQFVNEAPLESYGIDPNLADSYVSVRCDGGQASEERGTARCSGKEVPRATRDLRAGVEGQDAYSLAVVASREAVSSLLEAP